MTTPLRLSDRLRARTVVVAIAAGLLLVAVPVGAGAFSPVAQVESVLLEKLEEARRTVPAYADAAQATPIAGPRRDLQPTFLSWPNAGPLESGFKWRWGKLHEGLDIDGETGDPIAAAAGGRVTLAESDSGYGLTVELAHSGNFSGITTRYSHLSTVDVEKGDWVEQDQIIGRMGTTGYVTGSHLHFEVHDSDGPFDPLELLIDRGDEED